MSRSEDLYAELIAKGAVAIDQFIDNRQSEYLFLDFKRSSDQGKSARLSDIDRNNLAKAISGFGNSEGGVVVWGVDCSKTEAGADIAHTKIPIVNVTRFVSWLEGAVSGCTVPPHPGVTHCPIPINSGGDGFVATHIPKSYAAPHQVVGQLQYYIRAGSGFVPTPHMVLAGMFGRAVPPNVFHNYVTFSPTLNGEQIFSQLGLCLINQGPGIAADLYTTVKSWKFPGKPSTLEFDLPDKDNWSGNFAFGRFCSLISRPGYRVPPEGQSIPLILNLTLQPPFDEGIEVKGVVGAGNSPPHRFTIGCDLKRLEALYRDIINLRDAGVNIDEKLQNFVLAVWNLGDSM